MTSIIYKIVPETLWTVSQAAQRFAGSPVDLKDGFVHFSTAAQVRETAARHFAGLDGLLLVAVATADLGTDLRWEPSRGGVLFPHLYTDLPFDAVRSVRALPIDARGQHVFPALDVDERPIRRATRGPLAAFPNVWHDESMTSSQIPDHTPVVQQIPAAELKAMRERGDVFQLVDVRTPGERETAHIAGSRLLDEAYYRELLALDPDTALVFQCHHGIRSQSAAEHFLDQGFRVLFNLQGGIEAWSREVDPAVPRY